MAEKNIQFDVSVLVSFVFGLWIFGLLATPPVSAVDIPEKHLNVALTAIRHQVEPQEAIQISVVLENQGTANLKIFHPDLLVLGLSVRCDMRPRTPALDQSAVEAPSNFVLDLNGRSVTGKLLVLNHYFQDLPTNSRLWISWDRKKFLSNLKQRFPEKATQVPDYDKAEEIFTAGTALLTQEIKGVFEAFNRPGIHRTLKEVPASIFEPIVVSGKYFARIDLRDENTPLWFELFGDKQAKGVRQFSKLALQGFYDGLQFFDILKDQGYLIGGCPRNSGTGSPTGTHPRVTNRANIPHRRGTLSLATHLEGRRPGPVIGSIFFICLKDHPDWDKTQVPIGKLVRGEDVLKRLSNRKKAAIKMVTIVPADKAPVSLPKALIETSKGDLTVELYEDDAPNTVSNFIHLVEKGFFNPGPDKEPLKVLEKRDGYYIRTGSPDNTDTGGPDYRISDEVTNNTREHQLGTLSMCLEVNEETGKSLPNTARSQFFICLDKVAFWDSLYTPFGKVTAGIDVLKQLEERDTIESVRVLAKRRGPYKPRTNPLK